MPCEPPLYGIFLGHMLHKNMVVGVIRIVSNLKGGIQKSDLAVSLHRKGRFSVLFLR